MNYNNLLEKTDSIVNLLNEIDIFISKLRNKIKKLTFLYSKLDTTKIFKCGSNNTFQLDVIKLELGYYSNIYNLILNKYSIKIREISHMVMVLLISLKDIEIEKKKGIYTKIIPLKKINKLNYGYINEIINITVNNLKLIGDLILLIENYSEKVKKKYEKNNTHNEKFEITIEYKKKIVELEYNKICSKYNNIINYFDNVVKKLKNQIDKSEFIKFFVDEN
jgi:hypothetical protein